MDFNYGLRIERGIRFYKKLDIEKFVIKPGFPGAVPICNVYGKHPKFSNTLFHTFLPKFCF